jgi:hypothetical protein
MCSNISLAPNPTCVDNNAENDEANYSEDFDDREDELGLAIASDAEEVNEDDSHQENGDPSGSVGVSSARPKFESERCGNDFKRERNDPL